MAHSLSLPWAVHIADGVLGWPTLAIGFAVAALLALLAAWRVREEEVPRIALLTAAFFVASSIHVKLGPSSVHLLLVGLVGIVLGRRAPLAILIGVTLQALLIPHGGLSTIGVNTCAEALPALLAGGLFGLLSRLGDPFGLVRPLLAAAAALVWGTCLLFGAALLWTNSLGDVLRWSPRAGLMFSPAHLEPAWAFLRHPVCRAGLGLFALAAALLERRLRSGPGFAPGVLVGVLAVVGTTLLTGLVLLLDGAERWGTFVSVVFVAHLPLALLEGLIAGSIVAFLARVKPEMLGTVPQPAEEEVPPALPAPAFHTGSTQAVLAVLALLGLAPTALAHALEVNCTVDRAARRVAVISFYETGDPPEQGTVCVRRSGGEVLVEGKLDAKGHFAFSYDKAEPLSVHVRGTGGHHAVARITAAELGGEVLASEPSRSSRLRDLLVGVGLVLALASFVMSWRNSVRLGRLLRRAEEATVAEAPR